MIRWWPPYLKQEHVPAFEWGMNPSRFCLINIVYRRRGQRGRRLPTPTVTKINESEESWKIVVKTQAI